MIEFKKPRITNKAIQIKSYEYNGKKYYYYINSNIDNSKFEIDTFLEQNMNKNGVMTNKEYNISKSDYPNYKKIRNKLIEDAWQTVKNDRGDMLLRPSCVANLDCLVQPYKDGYFHQDNNIRKKTIEMFNYDIEQQIIIWRGGF